VVLHSPHCDDFVAILKNKTPEEAANSIYFHPQII
jgi:hypothetical protein